jgi:hypothetical protein
MHPLCNSVPGEMPHHPRKSAGLDKAAEKSLLLGILRSSIFMTQALAGPAAMATDLRPDKLSGSRRNFISCGSKQPSHFAELDGPERHYLTDRHAKGYAGQTPVRRQRDARYDHAQRT